MTNLNNTSLVIASLLSGSTITTVQAQQIVYALWQDLGNQGGGGAGWELTGTTTLTGDATIDQDGNELSFTENVNIPTINGVKVYRALLTQSGTSAPVATVLENTLGGTVVWTRTLAGSYNGTLSNAFPDTKTFIMPAGITADGVLIIIGRQTDNYISITVSDDDFLSSYPVQILVYP